MASQKRDGFSKLAESELKLDLDPVFDTDDRVLDAAAAGAFLIGNSDAFLLGSKDGQSVAGSSLLDEAEAFEAPKLDTPTESVSDAMVMEDDRRDGETIGSESLATAELSTLRSSAVTGPQDDGGGYSAGNARSSKYLVEMPADDGVTVSASEIAWHGSQHAFRDGLSSISIRSDGELDHMKSTSTIGYNIISAAPELATMTAASDGVMQLPSNDQGIAVINSHHGPRTIDGNPGTHKGLDFNLGNNTPVLATASGIVVHAGFDGQLGNVIVIHHDQLSSGSKHIYSLYAHLAPSLQVGVSDPVTAGMLIASSSNTGSATTRYHLHFEILISRLGELHFTGTSSPIIDPSNPANPYSQLSAVPRDNPLKYFFGDGVNITSYAIDPTDSSASQNHRVWGGWGDDTIDGDDRASPDDDSTMSFEGDEDPSDQGEDLIFGLAGDDMLYGNAGNDFLLGDDLGSGWNQAQSDPTINHTEYWRQWDYQVRVNADDLDHVDIDRVAGNDHLDGGEGDDGLDGGRGADVLIGGYGADELYGGEGHDKLFGARDPNDPNPAPPPQNPPPAELQYDFLDGGEGNDCLIPGNDQMISTVFVVTANGGRDMVAGDTDPLEGSVDPGDIIWFKYMAPEDISLFVIEREFDDVLFDGNEVLIATGESSLYIPDGIWPDSANEDNPVIVFGPDFDNPTAQWSFYELEDHLTDWDGQIGAEYKTACDDHDAARVSTDQNGTESSDAIPGGAGSDTVNGLGGDDTLSGLAGADTLNGGDGNDTLYGGADNDTLDPGAGNDFAYGEGDDDTLIAGIGDGDDLLDGGAGSDIVDFAATTLGVTVDLAAGTATGPETGSDTLVGIEDVRGGAGNDTITGNLDVNQLFGGAGDDTLAGGAGDDTLLGGSGDDTLNGGIGNDTMLLGAGADQAFGEAGDDTFLVAESAGNDLLDGGADTDTVIFTGMGAAVAVDLVAGTASGAEIGSDTLVGIENIVGGGGDDTLTGDAGANTLDGGLGDDALDGGAGDDTAIYAATALGVTVNLAASTASGADSGSDTLTGIENVIGGSGDDSITGNSAANTLDGGIGDDFLHGGGGDDVLSAGDGNDSLNGGDGNDYLDGGGGDDVLNGFAGSDTYVFGTGYGADTIDQNSGGVGDYDVLQLSADIAPGDVILSYEPYSYDLTISLASSADTLLVRNQFSVLGYLGLEEIRFGDVAGTVWDRATINAMLLATTSGDDTIIGFLYDDTIDGGLGDDSLNGWLGDDHLIGGAGADFLEGHNGNDILDGGIGDDTIIGGKGSDTLIVGPGGGSDIFIDSIALSSGDIDIVEFAAGITPADIVLMQGGPGDLDLIIGFVGTTNQITVKSQFHTSDYGVEEFRFQGGAVVWDRATIEAMTTTGTMVGTPGDDTLAGTTFSDTLSGEGGNDTLNGLDNADLLYGGAGNDLLNGGAGDDRLEGGDGADRLDGGAGDDWLDGGKDSGDTYVFAGGYGTDTVHDTHGASVGVDVLEFATGILPSDIVLSRFSFYDVILSVSGSTDSVKLSSQLFGPVQGVEEVRFVDDPGTVWTSATIEAMFAPIGTAGNDELYGFGTGDLIDGGAGDDVIKGWAGNDVLLGGAGNDEIDGSFGADRLEGGTGIDTLTGGSGKDTFVFVTGDGADTVQDFVAGAGTGFSDDLLDVGGLGYATFAEVLADTVQDGGDAVITTAGGDSITLVGVNVASLHEDDFVFA